MCSHDLERLTKLFKLSRTVKNCLRKIQLYICLKTVSSKQILYSTISNFLYSKKLYPEKSATYKLNLKKILTVYSEPHLAAKGHKVMFSLEKS